LISKSKNRHLLIDALNIRKGGGKVLLDYLITQLDKRELSYTILDHSLIKSNKTFLSKINPYASRKDILKEFITEDTPTNILYFGNFAAPYSLDKSIHTVTFVQNALLLDDSGMANFSLIDKLKFKLKRMYFKKTIKNSHQYIVQTPIMKERFADTCNIAKEKIEVFPFFDLDKIRSSVKYQKTETPIYIYPSSPQYHKNHQRLLDAWEILGKEKIFLPLQLTLEQREESKELLDRIDRLNNIGHQIKNIGYLDLQNLYDHITLADFMIFPSLKETIGLSLVEAVLLNTDIIVSELPYYKNTVKPSLTFDPYSPGSIAETVKQSLQGKHPQSEIILKNKIDSFINLNYKNPN